MGSQSNKSTSLLKNTAIVLVFSIAAKLLSLVRESAVAAFAGAGMEADAYYMVQGIYAVFELGLSTAIFQSFFPLYKQLSLEDEGKERSRRFANAAITLLLIIAAGLALIEICGRQIIVDLLAPGFSEEAKMLVGSLIWFSAPMLLFVIAAECISTVLRSHDRFARSQMRELGTHIASIIVVVLLYRKWGAAALGLSMLLGAVLRLVIQLPGFGKVYRYRPSFAFRDKDVVEMFRRIPATLVTAAATQLKGIVDRLMASLLPVGSVSALNYGHRIETALGGLLSTAIATGLYPEMVTLHTKGEKRKLRELLDRSVGIFALVAIPLCVGCFLFGSEIVTLIYQRGAFGAKESQVTARVFSAYILGTFFSGASAITANVFYAAGDTKTPMKINCIDLVLNVALNLLFCSLFGVVGLAAATSLSGVIAYLLRVRAVRRHVGEPEQHGGRETAKIVCAALIAGAVSVGVTALVPIGGALIRLALAVAVMIAVDLLVLVLMKSKNLTVTLAFVRNKLGR